MTRRPSCDRRTFALGALASVASPFVLKGVTAPAWAQAPASETWSQLSRLALSAEKLGLSVPRMSLGPESMTDDYASTMPAIVDFMDSLDSAIATETADKADAAEDLKEQASTLLGKVLASEKLPREIEEPGRPSAAATFSPPKYDDIKDGYRKLFESCVIRSDKKNEVDWYVSKLTDSTRRAKYQAIEDDICVPWYFVGIIHGMECGFDFNKHLHNGDPLKYKTVQVPKGRPATWNPPTDWHSSAVDALRYDKFADLNDWELSRMLFRWEAYNGWRSRMLHGINTPYLWSFSNHYSKGKYVADNVWDQNAVSKQCGAAVMMKRLVETGAIAAPA